MTDTVETCFGCEFLKHVLQLDVGIGQLVSIDLCMSGDKRFRLHEILGTVDCVH